LGRTYDLRAAAAILGRSQEVVVCLLGELSLDGRARQCKLSRLGLWPAGTHSLVLLRSYPSLEVRNLTRRNLTPPSGIQGILAQRRGTGGARHEISVRLTLRSHGVDYDGWALNVSRGGIRVVLEGRVGLGQELAVEGYDPDQPDAPPRTARVVWVQDEPDGAVVGLQFLDVGGSGAQKSTTPRGPAGG
jgi:hypothetical protein